MKRAILAAAVAAVLGISVASAPAQTDARESYDLGKKAFVAGQFDKSRELLLSASQLDAKSPEVHLWLGKACYELGLLDEALTAWNRTLELAPDEAYAKKMVAALRGQAVSPDVTLAVVDVMIRERQFDTALGACDKLLADKALTDAQRCAAMTRRAEALVGLDRHKDVAPAVAEVLARFGKLADRPQLNLSLARAMLHLGPEKAAEGVALLQKVIADGAGTPPAVAAQYELAVFDLDQSPTQDRADALAKWITANPDNALAAGGRWRLVEVYLARASKAGAVTTKSPLGAEDVQALAVAETLYKRIVRADEAEKLTSRILAHLQTRYASRQAYDAAIAAVDTLLKDALPRSSRLLALRARAQFAADSGVRQLSLALAAGDTFKPDALPPQLASAVAAIEAIGKEFPESPAWKQQAALAEQVRGLSGLAAHSAAAGQVRPPSAWAARIAMAVAAANADPDAVAAAGRTLAGVVDELSASPERWAKEAAVALQTQLASAIDPESGAWPMANWKLADLLATLTAMDFADNVRLGKSELNTALTDRQKQLLAVYGAIIQRQASATPVVLERLARQLGPWIEASQEKVIDEAYAQLTKAIPEAQKPMARLGLMRLTLARVAREHSRLLAAGLAPERALDPALGKVLQDLHAMQQGLKETDPLVAEIRAASDAILNHYKRLEYFDVAEQAAKVAPAGAVDLASTYAQFQLAVMKQEAARRDLDQVLKQRDGAKKLALTPAYKSAIEAWEKFITDHPASNLVPRAASAIHDIAEVYTASQADAVAAQIYGDFAAFAAKSKVLSDAAGGMASVAEQSAYLAATSLESAARRAMAKAQAERKPDSPPPAKLSDEWKAANDAYKSLVKSRPQTVYLSAAVQHLSGSALEYARIDAWDVADSIYADILASGLAIRGPERLEFCRGLCQLGKAMPDHAREVLGVITFGPGRTTGTDADGALARGNWADLEGSKATTRPAEVAMGERPGSTSSLSPGPAGGAGVAAPTTSPRPLGIDNAEDFRNKPADDLAKLDYQTLTTIQKTESQRATQVAMLRDQLVYDAATTKEARGVAAPVAAVSNAELARLQGASDAAYGIFKTIRTKYPTTITAEQARGEIMVMIQHWRTLNQWQRSAELAGTFLKDTPTDPQIPQLRLLIGRDLLAWAAQPIDRTKPRSAVLADVATRFEKARAELLAVIAAFDDEKNIVQQAQWDIAGSFLAQARVVDGLGQTLSRGQYLRAAKELRRVAGEYYDHPNIAQIPTMLWSIATELENRGYYDEAIAVYSDLANFDPAAPVAQQAAQQIASIYQVRLQRPLRAIETYMEINFARGGDAASQQAIFEIGSQLKAQKRWVESLHALETFVDCFPRHPNAGQALTMLGQVHQANEAWDDAIAAYQRVIAEYPGNGAWVQDARWSIAECTINLSKWRSGIDAYEQYVKAYPKDAKVAEAGRRISVLKDLSRYQTLIDEGQHAKAFDAQFQIGAIVRRDLANPAKAIIELRKVTEKYPASHLADDALYYVGEIYFEIGEIEKGREAMLEVAAKYPNSNFADDALYAVGQSYERESVVLAGLTRTSTEAKAREEAQKQAYQEVSSARRDFRAGQQKDVDELLRSGGRDLADLKQATNAANELSFSQANIEVAARKAEQSVETLSAAQLADREDKINAALRRAVDSYRSSARVPQADKAGDSLLRMSVIYDEQLKDAKAAVQTWAEIVRQFGGRAVAEEATWRLAQYYEREQDWTKAIETYKSFLSDYRRSTRAGAAQFAAAEASEHLSRWNDAKDAYQNYIANFPEGPMVGKAREQIAWIEKYRL